MRRGKAVYDTHNNNNTNNKSGNKINGCEDFQAGPARPSGIGRLITM